MEEEEEEDQREMARTKETKRMEPSAETDKSHLKKRDTRNTLADRRTDDLVTMRVRGMKEKSPINVGSYVVSHIS